MNKLPTSDNITVSQIEKGVCVIVEYNYESWETVVDLSEYKYYGCDNNDDLESLLKKSIKRKNTVQVSEYVESKYGVRGYIEDVVRENPTNSLLFTFSEDALEIDFMIDLGFKRVSKRLSIPKTRTMTAVEKLELYTQDKLDKKDEEIKTLKERITTLEQRLYPLEQKMKEFSDYVVIGGQMVSIHTKRLEISTGPNSQYLSGSNIVFNRSWNVFLENIENIAYLENLECLTMYTPDIQICDLSFLEKLHNLKRFELYGSWAMYYKGDKKLITIPNKGVEFINLCNIQGDVKITCLN